MTSTPAFALAPREFLRALYDAAVRRALPAATLAPHLPPPPKGPAYCDFLKAGAYALAFSCSGKPPFLGWLQGGEY